MLKLGSYILDGTKQTQVTQYLVFIYSNCQE